MDKIIPISTLKANVSEIVREIDTEPIVITQNGDARAVMLSKKEYDEMMDTLYMLKIAALGRKQIIEGKTNSLDNAFDAALGTLESE